MYHDAVLVARRLRVVQRWIRVFPLFLACVSTTCGGSSTSASPTPAPVPDPGAPKISCPAAVSDQTAGAPIVTHWEDTANPDGTVWDLNNLYNPASRQAANIITTPMNNWKPPYTYIADSNEVVRVVVDACAGVGKVP